MKEYAVYKGDDLLVIGTSKECAEYLGVLPSTIRWYASSRSYQKRVAARKKSKRAIFVENLGKSEE